MQIKVNGEITSAGAASTVAELLSHMGIAPGTVAIECDGRIIPRSLLAETPLKAGCAIEIVEFIGGG